MIIPKQSFLGINLSFVRLVLLNIYKGQLKGLHDDVISAAAAHLFFVCLFPSLMESKHCNTYWRNVWTAKGTMMKNKPHLITLHGSIFWSADHRISTHMQIVYRAITSRDIYQIFVGWLILGIRFSIRYACTR